MNASDSDELREITTKLKFDPKLTFEARALYFISKKETEFSKAFVQFIYAGNQEKAFKIYKQYIFP